ncbi:MAG: hypothetical protein ACJ746_09645 [Bryobacteraceae bacterium]
MRLANRSVVSKAALDTECEAAYFRVDDRHWWGFSNTVHIHQIDHPGAPQQLTGAAGFVV